MRGKFIYQKYCFLKMFWFITIPAIILVLAEYIFMLGFLPSSFGLTAVICLVFHLVICSLYANGIIFSKRINAFFIISSVPFSKYKNVVQKASQKSLRGLTCGQRYSRLNKLGKEDALNSHKDSAMEAMPPGHYRTITHNTVIDRIEATGFELLGEKRYLCKKSFKSLAYDISGRKCTFCKKRSHCLFRNHTIVDFYYIEFYVPPSQSTIE